MKNPKAVLDNKGEWFELYNPTDQAIDLRGFIFKDVGTNDFTVTGENPVLIQPHGYFVLGRNDDPSQNGGVNIGYKYSDFDLINDQDDEIIIDNETEIDKVEYKEDDDFPDPDGASMALLDPGLDNNIGSNWTTSTTSYGNGDLGTPGEANFPIPTSTPTPTPTSTSTPTSTPTQTPTSTPTPTPTLTSSPTPTPSTPQLPLRQFFQNRLRGFISRLFGLFHPFH